MASTLQGQAVMLTSLLFVVALASPGSLHAAADTTKARPPVARTPAAPETKPATKAPQPKSPAKLPREPVLKRRNPPV